MGKMLVLFINDDTLVKCNSHFSEVSAKIVNKMIVVHLNGHNTEVFPTLLGYGWTDQVCCPTEVENIIRLHVDCFDRTVVTSSSCPACFLSCYVFFFQPKTVILNLVLLWKLWNQVLSSLSSADGYGSGIWQLGAALFLWVNTKQ